MIDDLSNATSREKRLQDVLVACVEALENESNLSREQLLSRYPEFAEELSEFLADREEVEHLAQPLRAIGQMKVESPEECPTLDALADSANGLQPGKMLRYFGDYELLEQIGRGGMGVVYKARQTSLKRVVAVKMILAGAYASERDVERFRVEAEAAANLDHPHVLPIYEVGEYSGYQYFSMKLIGGGSFLAEPHPSLRELIRTLSKVCRAVHYAHQRGILHRDLKPENILLDADGTPYVTDFGLAKRVDKDSSLTQSGALVGTPSYMSPEQARGEKRVSTAADVFSLGAILYEVLTGQPPFKAATALETVHDLLEKDPAHPSSINTAADRDLSIIALKCLEKETAKRYSSAAALADDLDRWLHGEPILARPAPSWEKAWRWGKRRPAMAALLATIVLALAGGVTGLAISNYKIAEKQEETDAALRDRINALAEVAELLAKEQKARAEVTGLVQQLEQEQAQTQIARKAERDAAYLVKIARSSMEWNSNRPLRSSQLLDDCAPEQRRWEWHHLRRIAHAQETEYPDVHGITALHAVSTDGKLILTADATAVCLRDFKTGRVIRTFNGHTYPVETAALSPDGKRVASSGGERWYFSDKKCEVILWDAETGKTLRIFATDHSGVSSLAFSPDGKWLATAGGDNTARLWLADGTKEIHRWTLPSEKSQGRGVKGAFSHDGKRLAASAQASTTIWDVDKRNELKVLQGDVVPTFSRDGKLLVTIRSINELVVRDAETYVEQSAQRLDLPMVSALAFSPDSKHVAVGGIDGLVRVWDTASRSVVQTIRGQQSWVVDVLYSADGSRLVTSVGDPIAELFGSMLGRSATPQAIRVWEVARAQDYRLIPVVSAIYSISPAHSEVAIATGKEVYIYDLFKGNKLRLAATAPENVAQIAFHPDGNTLAVSWSIPPRQGKQISPGAHETHPVAKPSRVQLFDSTTAMPKGELHAQEDSMVELRFSSDGKLLAATGWGKTLTLLDGFTGKLAASLEGASHGASKLAFGPKDVLIRATTGSISWSNQEPERFVDGVIEIWDVRARKLLKTLKPAKGLCNAIALDRSGEVLAAAIGDEIVLINLNTHERSTLPTTAHGLAFGADGKRLAVATPYGVKIWDTQRGWDVLALGGGWSPGSNTSRVTFAPSEDLLLVNESDGLRIYDGRRYAEPLFKSSDEMLSAFRRLFLKQPVTSNKRPNAEPPGDDRPPVVKDAVAKSISAFEAKDPAAAAVHAAAALEADPDPVRQRMHRIRIALALQATPKLRPVMAVGSRDPETFAQDKVIEPPSTINVFDPTREWHSPDCLVRAHDAKYFATWNHTLAANAVEQAKKAGRSPWLVHVFDAITGKLVGPAIDMGRLPFFQGVALRSDGKQLAAIFPTTAPPKAVYEYPGDEGFEPKVLVLRIWDTQTGKRIGNDLIAPRKDSHEVTLRFAAGGRLAVAKIGQSEEATQIIWDLTTGTILTLPEPVRAVYGQPEDRFIVTTGAETAKQARLAHVRDSQSLAVSGQPLAVSELHAAAVSRDGKRAVLGHSYYLSAWDVTSGVRLYAPLVVYGGAKSIAISADGSRFVAAFRDRDGLGKAQVWDAATGDIVSPPMKTVDICNNVQLSADGQVVLTVTDRAAQLWDARAGEPITLPMTGDGKQPFGLRDRMDAFLQGDKLAVWRTYETSQFDYYSLAVDDQPPTELRQLVETIAGRRRDHDGRLHAIPAKELVALRKQALSQAPQQFGTPASSQEAVLLHRPDPRVKQLAERLTDLKAPQSIRAVAAYALGELKDPSAEEVLVASLGDTETVIRTSAASALGKLDPRSSGAVKALIHRLEVEGNSTAKAAVARALHGSAARDATSQLIKLLQLDKAAGVRENAAFALRGAANSPELVAALRRAFTDPQSWRVRVEAARTLASLVREDKECIEVLGSALTSNDDGVIQMAVSYLYDLGPRAAPVAAGLAKIVEKGNYRPHHIEKTWYALHALAQIGSEARVAVPVLLANLDKDESNPNIYYANTNYLSVRENMFAYTLARIGPEVLPELLKIMKEDKNSHRQRAAVVAVGFLGIRAKSAIPELAALTQKLAAKQELGKEDEMLKRAVDKALARIRDANALPVEKLN